MSKRRWRNKNRLYAYECPECGRRVELMMDYRKHQQKYIPPPCWNCELEMWEYSPNDRVKREDEDGI